MEDREPENMVAKGIGRPAKPSRKPKAGIQESKQRTINANTFDQFLDKECNDLRYRPAKQPADQVRSMSARKPGKSVAKKLSPSHRFVENRLLKEENKTLK